MAVSGIGWFGWHLTGHGKDCPVTGGDGLRCTHPDHEEGGTDGPSDTEQPGTGGAPGGDG